MWFYRNKSHPEGIIIDIYIIPKHINRVTMEHFHAWHPSLLITVEKWLPPTPPWVKINFDTAIRDFFSTQAALC